MKNIIIVGGGIAGLTAGVYAQQKGFKCRIFERHSISGGECTGWDRQGFHIDGCIHFLTGTKEESSLNKLWKQIGALANNDVYYPEYFECSMYEDTKVFLYRDVEKQKEHLLKISPEDSKEISTLLKNCKEVGGFEPPAEKPLDLMNLFEKLRFYKSMSKYANVFRKYDKISAEDYISGFKSTAIRMALKSLVPSYYRASTLIFVLGSFINGNAGKPKGGSRAFAKKIEDKFIEIGGDIKFSKEVKRVIIEGRKGKGVELTDGTIHLADFVLVTCDTNVVFSKLLDRKYLDEKFELRYNDLTTYPLLSCVYLAFGVNHDLTNYPISISFQTDDFQFEDKTANDISIKHYCYEPTFSPKNKSVITTYFHGNYDWWKEKKIKDRGIYEEEKKKLGLNVLKLIEVKFPELKDKIILLDVSTPLTNERYCGAFKGSYMSFGDTPKSKQMMHNGKVRNVDNLFLAGQWLMPPGGLPAAAITGKWAIDRISSI